MFLQLLFSSPALAIVWVAAILIALTFHEFAHALVGKLLGDDTAERMGRLTLNPIAHIDMFGFAMLLFVGFGWAKPVPFDPRGLKHPLRDGMLIALAGPLSNAILAAISAVILQVLLRGDVIAPTSLLTAFLVLLVLVNLLLMIFNLVPVYPLDGSKVLDAVFHAPRFRNFREGMMLYGPRVLFFAVIVSLATDFNPFFFVSIPAFALCETLLSGSCSLLLSVFFGG